MKKLTTILFLSIYLFNLVGSSIYIEYLIRKNEQKAVASIDEGRYENYQLVEIKVPLRTPYYSSSAGYERYYGEVDLNGHNYNYVQRKVMSDTVYLVCLPDYAKNKLQKAKRELGSGREDQLPDSKKGNSPTAKKQNFQGEYDQYWSKINLEKGIMLTAAVAGAPATGLAAGFSDAPVKPPSFKNRNDRLKKLNAGNCWG